MGMLCGVCLAGATESIAPSRSSASSTAAVIERYCLDCHDAGTKKGGIAFDGLDATNPAANPEFWEKVIRKLDHRQMPPLGEARPDAKTYHAAVAELQSALDRAAALAPNPGRTETFRRLNRTEYQNAIRDLLALDIDATALLPNDEPSHGFDNVIVGNLSPTLLDRYVSAAQKIARLAVGAPRKTPGGDTVRIRPDITQEEHIAGLPIGTRGGALILAIENGHFELAALLLDLGANPNDMRSGYSPLHVLSWVRKPDRGEDENGAPPPEGSGRLTNEQLIRKLVASGADVNARLAGGPSGGGRIARKGCTPFMLAADTADTPFLRLLVELGADPTLTNADGCTPLMAAAGLGTRSAEEEAGTEDEALEALHYLLNLGGDINGVSGFGDTAMHGAAFANFPKVIKFLAAKGARIEVWNQKNQRGWTPLLIAEGHRFGNFKPSFETIAAIHEVMLAHGITPPPPTPMTPVKGYGN